MMLPAMAVPEDNKAEFQQRALQTQNISRSSAARMRTGGRITVRQKEEEMPAKNIP